MTTKYVSVARGSDSTGDGSAANPWKTIDKAIGSGSAFLLDSANPNRLYIEPGVYRESVTITVSPTSAGPLSIIGDCDGGGFAAGGYSSPVVGLVDWRAWTDDATPMTANAFRGNGPSYITLDHIKFIGGNITSGVVFMNGGSDWTVRDCNFIGHYGANNGVVFNAGATAGAALNLTIERCNFRTYFQNTGAVYITVPLNAADWDLKAVVRNCMFGGLNSGMYMRQQGGSGAYLAGGVTFQNNTVESSSQYGVYAYGLGTAVPAHPIGVYGNLFLGCSLRATTSGQMVEDGNIFLNSGSNTNVAAGTNSRLNACPAVDFGDGRLTGLPLAPFGTPSKVSLFSGFGSYGTTPVDDLTGRNRPEGTGSTAPAVGCLERHGTGVVNSTYQDSGSSACMALVGPSSQERLILVDPQPTTIRVKVRWDGNHGDARKPQAVLIAEPQIGVAGQIVTAVSTGGTGSTPNAYETLTFSTFTPTSKGAVMLRMVSRAASGVGAAYFDTITLS